MRSRAHVRGWVRPAGVSARGRARVSARACSKVGGFLRYLFSARRVLSAQECAASTCSGALVSVPACERASVPACLRARSSEPEPAFGCVYAGVLTFQLPFDRDSDRSVGVSVSGPDSGV